MAKTRFDLIPFEAIGEIADVLEYGANKYEAHNWARGAEWSRYFSALCRHIFAWWAGEDKDPETGFSHLAHAGCCLCFLMQYQRHAWGTDDRFRGPKEGEVFVKDDGRGTAQREIDEFTRFLGQNVQLLSNDDSKDLCTGGRNEWIACNRELSQP